MENGTKALLMATGVIIAIFIISSMVFLFRAGGSLNEDYDTEQANNQLVLYNSKFEYFNKDDNTIFDMMTIASLAYDVNVESNYNVGNSMKIEVVIGNKTYIVPDYNPGGEYGGKNIFLDGSTPISTSYLTSELKVDSSLRPATDGELLRETIYDQAENKTIYKYQFKPDLNSIEYSPITGKIIYMKFEAYTI